MFWTVYLRISELGLKIKYLVRFFLQCSFYTQPSVCSLISASSKLIQIKAIFTTAAGSEKYRVVFLRIFVFSFGSGRGTSNEYTMEHRSICFATNSGSEYRIYLNRPLLMTSGQVKYILPIMRYGLTVTSNQ